jgi:hypothetical protein
MTYMVTVFSLYSCLFTLLISNLQKIKPLKSTYFSAKEYFLVTFIIYLSQMLANLRHLITLHHLLQSFIK